MMTLAPHRDRQGAAHARQAVLISRDQFWRPSDLRLRPSTTHHLLGKLEDNGELRRVRRGLYWRGTKTPLGMAPPSPMQLVAELAPGPGVGLAGLSAANALRMVTQVPRRIEIAIPGRAPSDTDTVVFVSRASRTGRREAELRPMEVALLEVLDGWVDLVEVDPIHATRRLVAVLRSGAIRADRLVDAAVTEPGRSRTRLRTLLNASEWPELAKLVPRADQRTESAALSALEFE